ncbi:MAG: ion transporter [Opitutae bacterium]|nr:ion transporter [Opitutae bacterium]
MVIGMIVLAGTLAGLETSAPLMARHGHWISLLDRAVLGFFVVEIGLRVAAHGRRPLAYFADGWNVFDCLIVAACLLPVGGPFASVLRLARVLRLMRLVHALPKLQLLVGALLKSLSAMGYVSLLLGLLFYIYAVAGVHLFGSGAGGDFGNLATALLSLFRVVTLDNWGDIFNRALGAAPPLLVAGYFISFIVFGTMIILNLFIGIIMNSMAEMHAELEADAPAHRSPAAPGSALEAELVKLEQQIAHIRAQLRNPPPLTGARPRE